MMSTLFLVGVGIALTIGCGFNGWTWLAALNALATGFNLCWLMVELERALK
jgi:hypothetical protein